LMYGIASGTGIGALRFLNSGPKIAANWAVGTFVFVSCMSWMVCRRNRAEELSTMQMIIDKYPERHARYAKEQYQAARAKQSAKGGDSTSNTQTDA